MTAFEASDYGLHNMVGNAWEWTADWWDTRFQPTPGEEDFIDNPQGPKSGNDKVRT